MSLSFGIFRAVSSLKSMVIEMQAKQLELGRITKTAGILISCGLSRNSIPYSLVDLCLSSQNKDGGWVSIVDTMWNLFFLRQMGFETNRSEVSQGLEFLNNNVNPSGLWGRSSRDMSRIPVSAIMLSFLPELANLKRLSLLEELWIAEQNSLTYKAAYVLLAFKYNSYTPIHEHLISDTVNWLVLNKRTDGSYGPWKNHPCSSDVYCTSIAAIGLSCYPSHIVNGVLDDNLNWLLANQLPQGIWPYHEIEDGASWGTLALTLIGRVLGTK